MSAAQIKAVVGVVCAALTAAALFFPEYQLVLLSVSSFLGGKEFFLPTAPRR